MNDNFDSRAQDVLRAHLKNIEDGDPLPTDVKLVELGLDSLGAVNLVLDLEDTFSIEFPDTMLTEATFDTVKSLCESLRELVSARASEATSVAGQQILDPSAVLQEGTSSNEYCH